MDKQIARLARGERRWMQAVALTALAAVFLAIDGVLLGWTAWAVVLASVALYLPLFTARVLRSSQHYGRMIFFAACLLLLLGRVGEEVVGAWQSFFLPTSHNLDLSRPMAMLLITDAVILGITFVVQTHSRNRSAVVLSVLFAALVAHALLLSHPVLAASADLLALVVMLIVLVQQIHFIYTAWLTQALTALKDAQLIATLVPVEHVTFRASRVMFRQDDPTDQLYLLVRGEVELLRRERAGVYEPVALLNAGQFFGEADVLWHTRRTTAAKAITDVECLTLDRTSVKILLSTPCASNRDDLILCCYLAWLGVPKQPAIDDTACGEPAMLAQPAPTQAGQAATELLGSLLSNPAQPTASVSRETASQGTLLVMRGAHLQQCITIDSTHITVGRYGVRGKAGKAVQLDDRHVSPRHLALNVQPDGLYARDLGSTHGTWVDGQRLGILPVRLRDGAEIRLGPDSVLCYVADGTSRNADHLAGVHSLVQGRSHTSAISPQRPKGFVNSVSLW